MFLEGSLGAKGFTSKPHNDLKSNAYSNFTDKETEGWRKLVRTKLVVVVVRTELGCRPEI